MLEPGVLERAPFFSLPPALSSLVRNLVHTPVDSPAHTPEPCPHSLPKLPPGHPPDLRLHMPTIWFTHRRTQLWRRGSCRLGAVWRGYFKFSGTWDLFQKGDTALFGYVSLVLLILYAVERYVVGGGPRRGPESMGSQGDTSEWLVRGRKF